MVGICDALHIRIGQLTSSPINEYTKLARINEQHLTASVAPAIAGIFVSREEPETCRNLSRVKELAR